MMQDNYGVILLTGSMQDYFSFVTRNPRTAHLAPRNFISPIEFLIRDFYEICNWIALLKVIYRILDILIIVFHSSLILFNLFGWIWRKTRIFNFITLVLTGASWLFLGLIYGTLGYCPLTDWHFSILTKLGETDLPDSYIKYMIDRITGLNISASLVDKVTLYAFLAALTLSVFFNVRDLMKSKKTGKNSPSWRTQARVRFAW